MATTPPPPPPPPPSAPPPPPADAPKKSNTAVKVIVIILIVLFLIIAGCVGACVYGLKKAKDYSEEAQKNPAYAAIKLAATIHPEIQIVSKNDQTGMITLRNKKTGEVVTLDTSAYTPDSIGHALDQFAKGVKIPEAPKNSSSDDSGSSSSSDEKSNDSTKSSAADESSDDDSVSPARATAMANVLKKFPAYVPTYAGGVTREATLNSFGGYTTGTYAFTTSDKPEKVVDFYEKKIHAAGNFTVASKSSDANDFGPTSHLLATRNDPPGTFSVTAESQQHGVRVVVSYTQR